MAVSIFHRTVPLSSTAKPFADNSSDTFRGTIIDFFKLIEEFVGDFDSDLLPCSSSFVAIDVGIVAPSISATRLGDVRDAAAGRVDISGRT